MSESSQTTVSASDGRPRSSAPGGVLPAVLMLGVLITAVSAIALAVILGAYALSADVHPVFYGLALWGVPGGFALLLIYVVLSARRRRGLRRTT